MVIEKCRFLADNTNEFLEKCMTIWEKISNLINKNFDSDPVCKDKYINTKIKSYNDDIITNFRNIDNENNKLTEENKPYKSISLILLDSIIKIDKKILSTNTFRKYYYEF